MVLTKKLTKIGNSWGVILPSEMMKMMGMSPNGEYELLTNQEGILLRPVPQEQQVSQDEQDQKVMKAMARFIKKYRQDLKDLS